MRGQKGFTLIELLIVIAIIGIIVAIAIPSLLRSRMSANEAAAVGSLKTIAAGQTDYNNNSNPHSYTNDLACLGSGTGAGGVSFIDPSLASKIKQGYEFNMEWGADVTMPGGGVAYWAWSATAWPIVYGSTGIRSFYIDESGVVRGADIGGVEGTYVLPTNN